MKDPAELYRKYFPRHRVGMVYTDRLRKHVTDLDVWTEVLEAERYRCTIERKAPFTIPMLIQNYMREMKRWREIETPADRNPAHQLAQRGEAVDFGEILQTPRSEETRKEMLRLFEEEAQHVYQTNKYYKRGEA